MGGQQTPENTDGSLENLWSCVHVERDGLNNILDSNIKPLNITHHYERVKDVDQCHGVIARDIIGSPVITMDPMSNSIIYGWRCPLTGSNSLGHVLCRILGPVRHRGKLTVGVSMTPR